MEGTRDIAPVANIEKTNTIEREGSLCHIYNKYGFMSTIDFKTGEVWGEDGAYGKTTREAYYAVLEIRDNKNVKEEDAFIADLLERRILSSWPHTNVLIPPYECECLLLGDNINIAFSETNLTRQERYQIWEYIHNHYDDRLNKRLIRWVKSQCESMPSIENRISFRNSYRIRRSISCFDFGEKILKEKKIMTEDECRFWLDMNDYYAKTGSGEWYRIICDFDDEEEKTYSFFETHRSFYKFCKMLEKERILQFYTPKALLPEKKYTGHDYDEDGFDKNDLLSMKEHLGGKKIVFDGLFDKINYCYCGWQDDDDSERIFSFLDCYDEYVATFTLIGRKVEFRNYFNNIINNRETYRISREASLENDGFVDETIATHMNEKNLEFENDEFKIIVPQTLEALMNEGAEMHNCVFVYHSERIFKGEEKIVFMRRKNDIESSYITVTAFSDGRYEMTQPLKKYNNRIDEFTDEGERAMAFLNDYNEYLETLN